MSAVFIASWTAAGIFVGVVLAAYLRRLLTSAPTGVLAAKCAAPLLTAFAFGVLAWRFGHQFDLLPYSVLAAFGVALGLVDLIEQRLPSVLIYSGTVLVGALLATSAILYSRGPDFLRALAGMAILAAFYLILALASRGGLGAGDLKLGGLLGLAMAWQGWPTLLAGTLVGWLLAALVRIVLRAGGRVARDVSMPLGPYLFAGAFVAVCISPMP
ncbi:prepilin peptidase [Solihabitans fulvus]|uniref:Prepilin peptidase n=1 Tax=Solihabitans fulvus TaxID=1892852 RepID=A0A5B2WTW4_9PSEU|nr:prepilin peptidase [Solihabitans fulvus]KAA2253317.1 prepilin peptidase [Solihabitans fulvus]